MASPQRLNVRRRLESRDRKTATMQPRKGKVYSGSMMKMELHAIRASENGSNKPVPYTVKQSRIGCVTIDAKNNTVHGRANGFSRRDTSQPRIGAAMNRVGKTAMHAEAVDGIVEWIRDDIEIG